MGAQPHLNFYRRVTKAMFRSQSRGKIAAPLQLWIALAVVLFLAGSATLLAPTAAKGAPGDLDSAFGAQGLTTHGFGPRPRAGTAVDLVRQEDGKLLVVGVGESRQPQITLARFDSDGSPDAEFGGGGKMVLEELSEPTAVALQQDGRIVVAGWIGDPCHTFDPARCRDFAVLRYAPDGILDSEFGGGDGIVRIDGFGAATDVELQGSRVVAATPEAIVALDEAGSLDPEFGLSGVVPTRYARLLEVDPAGRIVSAGGFTVPYNCSRLGCQYRHESRISRLLANGDPDPAFGGGDGWVDESGEGELPKSGGLEIAADGKIVRGFGSVVRRNSEDGSPDLTFGGGDGIATFEYRTFPNEITDLDLGPEGSILVSGSQYLWDDFSQGDRFVLARLTPDGSLDDSFGTEGQVVEWPRTPANAIVVAPDGSVISAGDSGGVAYGTYGGDLALRRHFPDGTADAGFGAGGFARSLTLGPSSDQATALALAPGGKIVSAGVSSRHCPFGSSDCRSDFAVARYDSQGRLDASFGSAGRVITDLGGHALASAVAGQSDGGVVAAGSSSTNCEGGPRFFFGCSYEAVAVRYAPDGTEDPSFGAGGVSRVAEIEVVSAMAAYTDGDLLLAGGTGVEPHAYCYPECGSLFALARLGPDGSLDDTFGQGGIVRTDIGADGPDAGDSVHDLLTLPDGRIVAAGASVGLCGTYSCSDAAAFARYLPDGSPDPSFGGGDGIVRLNDFYPIKAIALNAGSGDLYALATRYPGGTADQAILRLNPDGSLDEAFADSGSRGVHDLSEVPTDYTVPNINDLTVDKNGRIVLVGSEDGCASFDAPLVFPGCGFLAVRLNPDGTLDRSFGITNGRAGAQEFEFDEDVATRPAATAVALDSRDRIIALGETETPREDEEFALAALDGTGPPLRICKGKYSTMVGTAGDDRINGTSRVDVISGLGGDDVLRGLGRQDVLCGGKGRDQLFGIRGPDAIFGGPGRDQLYGGPGIDRLFGGTGADLLVGGRGVDRLRGGTGRDRVEQ